MNLQTHDGFCYECFRHIGPVVEIGAMDDHGHVDQESGGTFCLECLRKAVAALEAVLEPEEPEEEKAMKAIGRRDQYGQIVIYPEPRAVKGWWRWRCVGVRWGGDRG